MRSGEGRIEETAGDAVIDKRAQTAVVSTPDAVIDGHRTIGIVGRECPFTIDVNICVSAGVSDHGKLPALRQRGHVDGGDAHVLRGASAITIWVVFGEMSPARLT